jgi:23S rRNA pseudouridine2605 synthase
LIRINKYLSQCGVTSRRGADQLIKQGKVTVNDITVEAPGLIIDEQNDTVKVDGTAAVPVKDKLYILFNKPVDVLTTLHDPFRRRTVNHFMNKVPSRVYPVGRLDYDTEGVLILTNDGDLAYRLAHPKYEVTKVYHAMVMGEFTKEAAKKVAGGIKLTDGHIGKATAKLLMSDGKISRVELILTEGHKREVKQILKSVGYPLKTLRRVEFGGMRIEGLKTGRWRYLNFREVRRLIAQVGL